MPNTLLRKLGLFLFLAFPCVVSATNHAGFSASPAGDLKLIIVGSDSPAFIRDWIGSPSSEPVTIKRTRTVSREKLVVFGFFASGLTSDEKGAYDFSVSFYILGPDGEPIFGLRDYATGQGPLAEKPMIILGDPAFDIVFEASDPSGIYTFVGQVLDRVSGKKADYSYKLELLDAGI